MIMWHNNTINNTVMLKLLMFNEFRSGLLYSISTHITHAHIKTTFHRSRSIHNHQITDCKYMSNRSKVKCGTSTLKKLRSEIQDYLKSVNPEFLEICPKETITVSSVGKNTLYLVDPKVAKKFVELIADDLLKNKSLIIQANPGTGTLTVELLKIGIPLIEVLENNKCFFPFLQEIQREYPGRINLHKMSMFSLQRTTSKISEILKSEIYLNYNESIQIIGCTTGRFLRIIPHAILYPDNILLDKRVTFYLAVSPIEWKGLTCKHTDKRYSKLSILFQTLCNYKVIGALNRQAFVPWQYYSIESIRNKNVNESDAKDLYVVKIQARSEYLKKQFKSEDLQVFFQFIHKYLTAKSSRIIPNLEKWIPGCGPKLIARGYNIYTTFGDLGPNELMELFIYITKWPEYDTNAKYFMNRLNLLENDKLFLDKYSLGYFGHTN